MTSRVARFLAYSLCAGLLAGTAPAADPEWLGLVPASDTVAGLNVERLRPTKFGQTVFSKLEEWAKQSDDVTGRAEIEMLQEVREILLADPVPAQGGRSFILLIGSFKLADLQTIARTYGMSNGTVRDVPVFSDGTGLAVTLADSSLIIAGDPQTVRDSLARHAPAKRLDAAMAARVQALRSSHDFSLLTTAPLSNLPPGPPGSLSGQLLHGGMLKSVREIRGGITFGPKALIAFEIDVRDGQDATALANALRTVRLGPVITGLNPERIPPLFPDLELRAEGDTVKIGLALTEEELVNAFLSIVGPRRAPANSIVVIQTAPADSGSAPSSGDTGVVTLPGP
ncbi:MAG: hypothetical protein ACLQGV_20195 [Bryobacteraceae bacterium]